MRFLYISSPFDHTSDFAIFPFSIFVVQWQQWKSLFWCILACCACSVNWWSWIRSTGVWLLSWKGHSTIYLQYYINCRFFFGALLVHVTLWLSHTFIIRKGWSDDRGYEKTWSTISLSSFAKMWMQNFNILAWYMFCLLSTSCFFVSLADFNVFGPSSEAHWQTLAVWQVTSRLMFMVW